MPSRARRSAAIFTTPSSMLAWVRNTPACCCMVLRMSLATSCAYSPLVLASSRARRASERSAASAGSGLCVLRLAAVDDVVAGRAAEHQQVEQRVGAQPVGAVHADAGAFAHRVQAVDDAFGLPFFGATTWPWMLVGMPPIW
jgi:hypothetical protein